MLVILILEKWLNVDVLWGPVVHFSLVIRAICSRGCPLYGLCGPFCCDRLTTVNMLVGVGVGLVSCQVLTSAEATGPPVGGTGSLAMKPASS